MVLIYHNVGEAMELKRVPQAYENHYKVAKKFNEVKQKEFQAEAIVDTIGLHQFVITDLSNFAEIKNIYIHKIRRKTLPNWCLHAKVVNLYSQNYLMASQPGWDIEDYIPCVLYLLILYYSRNDA